MAGARRVDATEHWCRLNANIRSRKLLQDCRDYPAASNARRITFEYVDAERASTDLLDDAKMW